MICAEHGEVGFGLHGQGGSFRCPEWGCDRKLEPSCPTPEGECKGHTPSLTRVLTFDRYQSLFVSVKGMNRGRASRWLHDEPHRDGRGLEVVGAYPRPNEALGYEEEVKGLDRELVEHHPSCNYEGPLVGYVLPDWVVAKIKKKQPVTFDLWAQSRARPRVCRTGPIGDAKFGRFGARKKNGLRR